MTKTEIANLALSHAREQSINGNVETSPDFLSETIRRYYDQSLRDMLGRVRPSFAQTRTALALDATAPAFEYDNQFILPTDYLEMVQFNGEEMGIINDRYVIESRRLLTNEGEARIIYIREETDTAKYDAEFVEAFALLLGSKVSSERRGNEERARGLYEMAMIKASESSVKSAHARKRYNSRDKVLRGSRWTNLSRRISTNESTTGTGGVIYDS